MTTLKMFEGYGVELELMIVDRATLRVRPIADELLRAVAGEVTTDWEEGPIAWSNELVLHVIELKTNGPVRSLVGVADAFQTEVRRIDGILADHGAMLLPTAMHPTMDPLRETRLWPHDNRPIYDAYHRVFDCRGHGWSNLQSTHLNLPFDGDDEFGRLHLAIRAILPLLGALAASSPLVEGRRTGVVCNRLDVYSRNQRRIPSILGRIVPEPVTTEAAYRREILEPMYRDIAPVDPEGTLRHEFLNSRGAIARFERDAIEIRVLDVQEAPVCDLGIVHLVTETLKALVDERHVGMAALSLLDTEALARQFHAVVRHGDRAVVEVPELLHALGIPERRGQTVGDAWRACFDALPSDAWRGLERERAAVETILEQGPLSRRIARTLGKAPTEADVERVYRTLADGLLAGVPFRGA